MNPMGEFVEEQKFLEPVLENKFNICRLQTNFTHHIYDHTEHNMQWDVLCPSCRQTADINAPYQGLFFFFFKGGLSEYWVEINLATLLQRCAVLALHYPIAPDYNFLIWLHIDVVFKSVGQCWVINLLWPIRNVACLVSAEWLILQTGWKQKSRYAQIYVRFSKQKPKVSPEMC